MGEYVKRGFASLIVGALLILAILFFASGQLLTAGRNDAALAALETRLASERFADANASFSAAFDDALVDSAYVWCGCSVNQPSQIDANLRINATSYFNNLSVMLNDSSFSVNYSGLNISPNTVSSCTSSYTYLYNYSVRVNSTDVAVAGVGGINRTVNVTRTATWVKINVSTGSTQVVAINVSCV